MTDKKGKFIVIEGLEGAGKSTAIETILSVLKTHDISAITTREPGGTPVGEILRTVIKNPDYKDTLDDKAELLLFYASRIQLIRQVIKPALALGQWVIADRFELSTFAYQGAGRGIHWDQIAQLSAFALDGFKPDLTLYLDISPTLGMERARLRGQFDRIEQQGMDFFNRVHEGYLKQLPMTESIEVIDASLPLPAVQYAITQALTPFIASC